MRRISAPYLLAAIAALALSAPSQAEEGDAPWCAPELETLAHDVCYHPGVQKEPHRTLVVFLHGLVEQGAGWQHAQQRGIVRGARRLHFAVLAPRGRPGLNRSGGAGVVAWPTSVDARAKHEAAMLAEWQQAQRELEKRAGAPFDEVFVVGFSNGAYYASSLGLRGRLPVDGYAVFAGGTTFGAPGAVKKEDRVPIFVGIAGKDRTTAADSRALARTLKKHRWPHRAETRKVGHAIADAHLDHAIAYLRQQVQKRASKAKPDSAAR